MSIALQFCGRGDKASIVGNAENHRCFALNLDFPEKSLMLMRTELCSCLGLLQQGNETMADRLLVLVPHEQMHAPRSILIEAEKLGSDLTEMGATKPTVELISHRLCIAHSAPAKMAREGWPGNTALLNGQRMGPKSELHQSPELTDAHWQLIIRLKAQITGPAKPMVICAKLRPLGRSSPG